MIRTLRGTVVSDKMDKTVVVAVQTVKEHPLYRKKYKVTTKFKAHDEANACHIGDLVEIFESRCADVVSSLPVARSALYDVQNIQPSETFLPASPRSKSNGGSMICQPSDISPDFGSIFTPAMTPLYSVAYFSIGAAVPLGMGIEKRVPIIAYSVFGVTKAPE